MRPYFAFKSLQRGKACEFRLSPSPSHNFTLDPARGGIAFTNSGKIENLKKGSIFDSKTFFAKDRA